jgi:hypothetical protein
VIAVLPLCFSVVRLRKSSVPVAAAIVFSLALPWCQRIWTETFNYGAYRHTYTRNEPNLAAHALVAAFTVFLVWWGVHHASRALVNLGIVGFALAVGWFYFSDIYGAVSRSLGLIGLGILFLAGGWALEKMRRSLVAGMDQKELSAKEAL